ncbi:alanine racemase [Microbacterium mitrae]|uniref:Alanine racemase n=1 Tax=Microbacterium mitrae TaxID=664640 RepID=A0A5C8HQ32_9MICO|nr:alanine racemase C-terminal domain-containing protein [Microbacterium mitrae]TXK05459.1 alanine racemase [Microbacterium mitrae]
MEPLVSSRTLPLLQVSRSAIQRNLEPLDRRALVSVEHDALGMGAEVVGEIARILGFLGVRMNADGIEVFDDKPRPRGGEAHGIDVVAGLVDGTTPAVRFAGHVLGVKDLKAGEGVSYGYTFVAPTDTRVALVTGGYAQGLVRALGNNLDPLVAGARRRIVGRVAMDVCVVDIGDASVHAGEDVVFLGDSERGEPTIAEWAKITGMQAEELVAPLGLRARREVVA